MKDDLISRRYLIEAFKEEFYYMYSDNFKFMLNWFENLPAADLSEYCDKLWMIAYERGRKEATAEKKGEWIKDRLSSTCGWSYGVHRCSVCDSTYQDIGYEWNFCPNCGARMEESDG